jgi:microcystin-dependent protein
MADPFVAEVRVFGFYFAPKGWAFCEGQLLPLSQNTALFSLLGTTYGGDGKSTFALPNMKDSACMHPGQGNGLSLHDLGESGGSQSVALTQGEMPAHTHLVGAADPQDAGNLQVGGPTRVFAFSGNGTAYNAANSLVPMSPMAISVAGGSLPHNNMMPFLTLNFCIALQGVFPARP